MTDDLTRPLGLEPARKRRPILLSLAIAAPLAVILAGGAVYLLSGSGASSVTVAVQQVSGDQTGSVKAARPHPAATPSSPAGAGLTEVAPPDASTPTDPGDVVITDPDDAPPVRLAAVPRDDLVEQSRYGPLPRIADDGTRPLDAYARAVQVPAGLHRVAIVIGGMGISSEATASSLDSLPGEVTLAFAPYGKGLAADLAKARAAGHEVLLQVPLEPYGYPDVNPGPHTLIANASTAENLDELRWLLSRLTTYVGVMNYMGARFTSSENAISLVLAEIGKRGLLYLDDGSSANSRAAAAATGKAPFLQADVVLDADTTPAAIDARLDQLAAIARQRGYAIGTGSAFASTIDRVDAFAAEARKHGIVLVPVTQLLSSGRT